MKTNTRLSKNKFRSKNTNPEIKIQKLKNLKITIFSNPAKSSNPKAPKYQINPKNTTQLIQTKKISNSEKPISSKLNPANPPHSQKPKLKTTKTKYKNQNQNQNQNADYEDFSDSLISFNLLLFSKQFHWRRCDVLARREELSLRPDQQTKFMDLHELVRHFNLQSPMICVLEREEELARQLSGEVPESLKYCRSLHTLYLSNNSIFGPILSQICN